MSDADTVQKPAKNSVLRLCEMGRYLGLDVGNKTIGVAVSDEMKWMAQPVKTIKRIGKKKDYAAISQILETYTIEKIVVGLPKNMDNTIGPQAEKAMEFGEGLKKRFDVEVVFADERLTTSRSTQILIESGVRRENRKQYVDQLAAVQILQTYLDRERR